MPDKIDKVKNKLGSFFKNIANKFEGKSDNSRKNSDTEERKEN